MKPENIHIKEAGIRESRLFFNKKSTQIDFPFIKIVAD